MGIDAHEPMRRRAAGLVPALPLAAAAWLAGTAAAAALGGPWWATVVVAGLAGAAYAVFQAPQAASFLVIVAAVAITGAAHARFQADDARLPVLASLTGMHDVVGVIRDDARVRGTTATVDLSIEAVDGARVSGGLRLSVPAGREPLRGGDRVAFTGEIERPSPIDGFDYPAYLRSHGVYAVSAFPERWEVIAHDVGSWWHDALRSLRRWSIGNVERVLPEPESSLAIGVLIGERRSMPAALTEDLRATGTTHLVVVSGQNVVLLLATVIAILTTFVSRRRASLLALALLPMYVVFVGLDPPVVRAALMAVGVTLAEFTGRRTPGWIFLAYAAAIMLAFDPLLARNVGFQLSFAATAGVLLLAPAIRDAAIAWLRLRYRGLAATTVEMGSIATGAALAVLPVQAATFETVSLVQLPANVVLAPFYEVTLMVALLAAVVGWAPGAATAFDAFLRFVPGAFTGIVGWFAGLPVATVEVAGFTVVAGIAWYALLACGLWLFRDRPPSAFEPAGRTGLAPAAALLAVAGGVSLFIAAPGDHLASVTVLDVGQGQAVLVRDGGASVLVDTGPPDGAVIAALNRSGQGRFLDAVVISHDDRDHSGGLSDLGRRYDVAQVLAGWGADLDGARWLATGDRIEVSGRTRIEVLSPEAGQTGSVSDNNRSLVLLVTIGELRILLPADIEAGVERALAESRTDYLRADALVVAHHGSRTSSTPEFVGAVQPRVAVVSVGADNPFGHPHPEVLARFEDAVLLRTDEHGDVELRSDGQELWVEVGRMPQATVH